MPRGYRAVGRPFGRPSVMLGARSGSVRARCSAWLGALALIAPFEPQGEPGRYVVSWVREDPPRLRVEADLPIEGRELAMDATRPGSTPELDAGGWPALVLDLSAVDEGGTALALERAGDGGWRLAQEHSGRIGLRYEIDYEPLAALDWPAPREACWLEADFFSVVARSIFVTTQAQEESSVSFELRDGWRAVTPWDDLPGSPNAFAVPSAPLLTENLLVFARTAPEVVSAGGLRVLVVSTQAWVGARTEVQRVLEGAIPRLAGCMGSAERGSYLVALLPHPETGGESFRSSFAMTFAATPSRENAGAWGNTIAHEVFHMWNGWGLHGADYASTQWFQEGFTEYAANVALVASGIVTPEAFLAKLAEHVRRSRELSTSLEATGGRKGPPLYSAGALVAFDWDVRIRHATDGTKGLCDFLRALWERTGDGGWPYAWADLEAALAQTAELDWRGFHVDHIAGREPLPLAETFALAGIALRERAGEAPELLFDPAASEEARALWRALTTGS
jgi:predicted metalloprotease with PDZ domain